MEGRLKLYFDSHFNRFDNELIDALALTFGCLRRLSVEIGRYSQIEFSGKRFLRFDAFSRALIEILIYRIAKCFFQFFYALAFEHNAITNAM